MSARTQVGIVEWARRIDRARRTEMWLAEALAARVAAEPDVARKVDLVRGARFHAWHADLWKSVAPLLHDFSPDEVADRMGRRRPIPTSVAEQLDDDYTRMGKRGRRRLRRRRSSAFSVSSHATTTTSQRADQRFRFPTTPVETLDGAGIVAGEQRSRGRSVSPGPRASLVIRAPNERRTSGVAKERVERDEEDLVRLYLTDIGQYPLLTKDDEVRLAQQIEQGNSAREELVGGAKELTPAKKRELRRTSRRG